MDEGSGGLGVLFVLSGTGRQAYDVEWKLFKVESD